MSGPEYEESEINEITKLTRRAHGTGSAVRARAILGQRDIRCSLHFPWARRMPSTICRAICKITIRFNRFIRRSNGVGCFSIRSLRLRRLGPCFSRARESKEQKSFLQIDSVGCYATIFRNYEWFTIANVKYYIVHQFETRDYISPRWEITCQWNVERMKIWDIKISYVRVTFEANLTKRLLGIEKLIEKRADDDFKLSFAFYLHRQKAEGRRYCTRSHLAMQDHEKSHGTSLTSVNRP